MNHVIQVFKDQGVVAGFKKLADVVEDEFESAEGEFPELGNLVAKLTSDGGAAAYQVAKDAFANWQTGMELPAVAEAAVAEALAKGITVLKTDVADWLGLLDRNAAAPAPQAA